MAEYGGVVSIVGVAHYGGVGEDGVVCSAILGGEACCKRWPGYARFENYIAVGEHHIHYGESCCKVKTLGHTHTEVARTLGVEVAYGGLDECVGRVVVGAMPRESDYVRDGVHECKVKKNVVKRALVVYGLHLWRMYNVKNLRL